MYLTAWMKQFEIKHVYIEFGINDVSVQGKNNVKIKLNLRVEEIC